MSTSRLPRSSQSAVHTQLRRVVERHLASPWRQPIRAHTHRVFERMEQAIPANASLILDSGCGTGHSTRLLALAHPEDFVIGIDKSEDRLTRAPEMPANALVVRAELADFWRLARGAGWRPVRHYLFYPNPWPKPGQLQRRWHGHPVFPELLALGGQLELRTNFELYAREFARALEIAGIENAEVVSFHAQEPVSPFERKYADSGHELYKLIAEL